MTRDWLLPLLGYDVELASELSFEARGQLRSVCLGWLAVLVLLAWPLGYVFWLTEHSVWLATIAAVGVYALCLNLLRVAVAGGGAGLTFEPERVKQWTPGLVPPVFLLVMGCLMAQPAQLLLTHHDHRVAVEAKRTELLAKKAAMTTRTAELGQSPPHSPAAFDVPLAECEFAVYRVQLLWRNPSSAARFTALYALLVLIPVFWSRFVALEALRAYEWRRYTQVILRAAEERKATAHTVFETLSAWATYVGTPATANDGYPTGVVITDDSAQRTRRALSAPRRALRSQPILRWRNWS